MKQQHLDVTRDWLGFPLRPICVSNMNLAHGLMTYSLYSLPVYPCFDTFALSLTFDSLLSRLLGHLEPRGTLSISNRCSAFSTKSHYDGMVNLQSVYTDTHSHRGFASPRDKRQTQTRRLIKVCGKNVKSLKGKYFPMQYYCSATTMYC